MNDQKVLLFLLVIISFLSSCSDKLYSQEDNGKSKNKIQKIDYGAKDDVYNNIGYFKYLAFMKCIRMANNNSEEINSLLEKEICIEQFPGYYVINTINAVALETKEKIIQDSIYMQETWLLKNPDYQHLTGTRSIAFCLEMYNHPRIDSLKSN